MRSSDSSTPAENAAVELEAVSMIYGSNGSKVAALDALSLVFARGTFTAVMGPSGSGKTTLLQSASGLVRPTKGAVLARRRTGESVCARARRRGTSLVRRRGCADAVRPPPARRGHELTLHFDNGHFALAADHDVRDPARVLRRLAPGLVLDLDDEVERPGRIPADRSELRSGPVAAVRMVTVMFGLEGRVAVVTGATGVLGGAVARGLRDAGASVAVLARSRGRLELVAAELDGLVLEANVLDASALERSRDRVLDRFGRLDVLVNAAGGNVAGATVDSFFDLTAEALEEVLALNLMGTALPSRIFGAHIGDGGAIVNLSSMAAERALTRVAGYGAAKAAVESLTRSLAVELAPRGVRVNAVAPGFFVSEQNRALLFEPDGTLSDRGARIVAATPAGRFGEVDEVASVAVWLCGDASTFVTGATVPVDGGFSAFSGI